MACMNGIRSIPPRAATLISSLCVFAATACPVVTAQAPPPRVVIFQQSGFPTIGTEPITESVLRSALGASATVANLSELRSGQVLKNASLLVLPYGSAVPVAAWASIRDYLSAGGNLLLIGGQPLRVPVLGDGTKAFDQEAPQDSYSRELDFRHSYAVPLGSDANHFSWRKGYDFLPAVKVSVQTVFAEEGRLNGLGYLDGATGTHLAAPVIVSDHPLDSKMPGVRIVAIPITPTLGYWQTSDGKDLIRTCAEYAEGGSVNLTLESQYAALRPGELPQLTARLRGGPATPVPVDGTVGLGRLHVSLHSEREVIDDAVIPLGFGTAIELPFRKAVPSGVYTVTATWTPAGSSRPQEFAENGFVVEDLASLETGPRLGVAGDFLTLGSRPFLPVGTNYFTTEENGWDFSGPRNAAVWEQDFADMERHGVSFVRTGVWGNYGKYIEPLNGGANERFLRNVEAFLAAAQRHHIAVNFTFFAFSPRVSEPRARANAADAGPAPPNPFLDPRAVQAEEEYVASVAARFRNVPWLSYDLINEPSFSNPRVVFHGNVPNNDPAELTAWRSWLQKRYVRLDALADAWRVTASDLRSFDAIPLPRQEDLNYGRSGNAQQVRAFDYNLFAQEMFAGWVRAMCGTVRRFSASQLINVGQDEGGISNRVLNQFYATAGVSFTTNHTYWNDDALLWDSVAAKRPGIPNITGETGYQPAWNDDGSWRYDELTGTPIEERKWALGFAAGSSGAMQWDWAREPDFGMQRSDGSAKVWEAMMRNLGTFAKSAAPYATGLTLPQVAIVLPESLQLSVFNAHALEAQQTAVRVLYQWNRVEAYAVGEYAMETLGSPKLILLPSAYGLNDKAWEAIEARVRAGATLLISGPFSADEHLHADDRAMALGLPYRLEALAQREEVLHLGSGNLRLEYPGLKTTTLDRAVLPSGENWAEISLGKGRVLFSALPLELNSSLESVAAVYDYALKKAAVEPTYTTDLNNPGVLICPTRLPQATLYVLSSESANTPVSFRDLRSGKTMTGKLAAGRSALLLVGLNGDLLASYGWE